AIAIGCAFVVRRGPLVPEAAAGVERPPLLQRVLALLARPQFLIVCAMSFTLTLMRESFNVWSVDYLTTGQTGEKSVGLAALGSTPFDIGGYVSILAMGWIYDRTRHDHRRWLIAAILAVLVVVLLYLHSATTSAPVLIFVVGLLVYGPYSLL